MLNQAPGDREILAKQLSISPKQLSFVTNSSEGEGLLFYGNTILPFIDRFDRSLKLYSLMTTKFSDGEKATKMVNQAKVSKPENEDSENIGGTAIEGGKVK